MAAPTYDVDATNFTLQPQSGLYNPNSQSVVASSFGSSSLANYSVTSQSFGFQLFRQNIIIPNGTYYDPNVTAPVGASFGCSATHNRIIVYGYATYTETIIPSTIFNVSAARIAQTFVGQLAASGSSGTGLYTSGNGIIATYQPGYIRNIASTTSIPINRAATFTFPILLRQGGYSSLPVADPINTIVFDVAQQIKNNYIPELRLDLLFV
jgi:hypothetical protein